MSDIPAVRKSLAANLAAARGRKGLTQQELADAGGTSKTTVLSIEKGHSGTNVDLLESLAKAVGLKSWELLDDGTGPSAHQLADCLAAVSARVTGRPPLAAVPTELELLKREIIGLIEKADKSKLSRLSILRDTLLVELGDKVAEAGNKDG